MYCKYFHPDSVMYKIPDLDRKEKVSKMREDRLDAKSHHYPSGDFKDWKCQDKWRYFGNYVIFGNWREETEVM